MLDTVMAMWNRRQRGKKTGRAGLLLLIVCVCVSFLLFVMSARSAEKRAVVDKKALPVVLPRVTPIDIQTPSPTANTARVVATAMPTHVPTPTPTIAVAISPISEPAYPVISSTVESTARPAHAPDKTHSGTRKKQGHSKRIVKHHVRRRARKHHITTPTPATRATPSVTATPTVIVTPTPAITVTVSLTPSVAPQETSPAERSGP